MPEIPENVTVSTAAGQVAVVAPEEATYNIHIELTGERSVVDVADWITGLLSERGSILPRTTVRRIDVEQEDA